MSLRSSVFFALLVLASIGAHGQAVPAQGGAAKECDIDALQVCAMHVLQDEYKIVTSPLRVSRNDLLWIAPFAAGTGYTMTQDAGIMQDLGHDPGREKDFNTASNIIGIYAPLAF